jgi:hypothetical protein
MVVVLVQNHHTLEHGKEKDLDAAHDQDKGRDGSGDLREKTKAHREPFDDDVESQQDSG